MSGKGLVGEEIDGEGTEWEDCGIKSEAEADHDPVRQVEVENAFELQLVRCACLPELVPVSSTAFKCPIDDRANYRQNAGTDSNQKGTLPAWFARGPLRIKRAVGPGRR